MEGQIINPIKAIVKFARGKTNITYSIAPMTMAKKYLFSVLIIEYYYFTPTWINHTMLVVRYLSVLVQKYF